MFNKTKKNPSDQRKTVTTSSTYSQNSSASSTRSVVYSQTTKYTETYSNSGSASVTKFGASTSKDLGGIGRSFDAIKNDRASPFDREFNSSAFQNGQNRLTSRPFETDARHFAPPSSGYVSPYRSAAMTTTFNPQPIPRSTPSTPSKPSTITQITSIAKNPIFTTIERKVGQEVVKSINKKPTKTLNPGIVYIFNHEKFDNGNETRVGTQEDVKKLKMVFGRLKMVTYVYNNYTVKQIELEARKIQNYDYTKKSCIVIVILTHGSRHDMVSAKDDTYSIDDVLLFPMLKNKTLVEKPKIFIIQACKGDNAADKYSYSDARSDRLYSPLQIAKLYSTFEGFVSYRGASGSMFIQMLCDNLDKDGLTKNVIEIMEETIKQIVEQYSGMQVPTITHNMTNPIIFGKYL